MTSRTIAQRNLDAEVRCVEEGLRAQVQDGKVIVRSASYREKGYTVTTTVHVDGRISFSCEPFGRNAFRDDHLATVSAAPGTLPCLHAACAARSLASHRLARMDGEGRWTVTDRASALQPPVTLPDNPLAGIGLRG